MRLRPLSSAIALFVTASMTRPEHLVTGEDLTHHHRLLGYSDCAVHFVIERNGKVCEGRPLQLPAVLAGAKRNAETYQVALLGGLDDQLTPASNFTDAQYASLQDLAERFALPVTYDPKFPQ